MESVERNLFSSETREQMTLSIPAVCLTEATGAKLQDLPTALQAFQSHVFRVTISITSVLKTSNRFANSMPYFDFFPVGFVLLTLDGEDVNYSS